MTAINVNAGHTRSVHDDFWDRDKIKEGDYGTVQDMEISRGDLHLEPLPKLIPDAEVPEKISCMSFAMNTNFVYIGTEEGVIYKYSRITKQAIIEVDFGTPIYQIEVDDDGFNGIAIGSHEVFIMKNNIWSSNLIDVIVPKWDELWGAMGFNVFPDKPIFWDCDFIGDIGIALGRMNIIITYDFTKDEFRTYILTFGFATTPQSTTWSRTPTPVIDFMYLVEEQSKGISAYHLITPTLHTIKAYEYDDMIYFAVAGANKIATFTEDDLHAFDYPLFDIDVGVVYPDIQASFGSIHDAVGPTVTDFFKIYQFGDTLFFLSDKGIYKFSKDINTHSLLFDVTIGEPRMQAIGELDIGEYIYFESISTPTWYLESNSNYPKYQKLITSAGKKAPVIEIEFKTKAINVFIAPGVGSTGPSIIGHYDYRNWEKYGIFTSNVTICEGGENQNALLDSVDFFIDDITGKLPGWNSITPTNTYFTIEVSNVKNPNTTEWYNVTDLNEKSFDNWTKDFENNYFRYRVQMWSYDQLDTPRIYNINFQLHTYLPPWVIITPPEKIISDKQLVFSAKNTRDEDSGIAWFEWEFGDPWANATNPPTFNSSEVLGSDKIYFSTDLSTFHSYYPGTYYINLTVEDTDGYIGKDIEKINVPNRPPHAIATMDYTGGTDYGYSNDYQASLHPGGILEFDSRQSWDRDALPPTKLIYLQGITSVNWDLDQFGNSSLRVHQQTYDEPGDYTVELEVIDDQGREKAGFNFSHRMDINVAWDTRPIPMFDFINPSGTAWEDIDGDGNVDGEAPIPIYELADTVIVDGRLSDDDYQIINMTWEMGDGTLYYTNISNPIVRHDYEDGGFYQVSLTVSDNHTPPQTTTLRKWVKIQYWPLFGDWIIDRDMRVHDVSTGEGGFHGNVIVARDVHLIMDNVDPFEFACGDGADLVSPNGQYRWEIGDGAKCEFWNSTIGNIIWDSKPTLDLPLPTIDRSCKFYYNFMNYGTLYANNSKFRDMNFEKLSSIGGITFIGNSKAYFKQSIIELSLTGFMTSTITPILVDQEISFNRCEINSIEFSGFIINTDANLTMSETTLLACREIGGIYKGDLDIYKSNFEGCRETGLWIQGDDINTNFADSVFKYNGDYNFHIMNLETFKMDRCDIRGNGDDSDGLFSRESILITNTTIQNADVGLNAQTATITLLNGRFSNNHFDYLGTVGGQIIIKNYLECYVTYKTKPKKDAFVAIYEDGIEIFHGETNAQGRIKWIPVIYSYSKSNNFHPTFIPTSATVEFTIKDEKMYIRNRTINMSKSHEEQFKFADFEKPDEDGAVSDWEAVEDWFMTWGIMLIIIAITWGVIGYILNKKKKDEVWMKKWSKWLILIGIMVSVGAVLLFLPPDVSTIPLMVVGILWGVILAILYFFRKIPFIQKNKIRIILIGIISSLLLWMGLTDISKYTPYIAMVMVWSIVLGILLLYGKKPFIRKNFFNIIIGTALFSVVFWLVLTGSWLYLALTIIIGILVAFLFFMFKTGRLKPPQLRVRK